MLSKTHHKIATTIYENLPEYLRDQISLKDFRRGNKAPDFMVRYKKFKHTVQASFSIIQDEINEILNQDSSKSTLSRRLGHMCHFISDYACAYHNNLETKAQGLKKHIQYEREIEKIAKTFDVSIDEWKTDVAYDELMGELHQEVKGYEFVKENSPYVDLANALKITYRFVHSFMEERFAFQTCALQQEQYVPNKLAYVQE